MVREIPNNRCDVEKRDRAVLEAMRKIQAEKKQNRQPWQQVLQNIGTLWYRLKQKRSNRVK